MRRTLAPCLALMMLTACPLPETDAQAIWGDCEDEDAFLKVLGDVTSLRSVDTYQVDLGELRRAFEAGTAVEFPAVDPKGEPTTIVVTAQRHDMTELAREAELKAKDGATTAVQLRDDAHWILSCGEEPCGVFTFLDGNAEEPVQFEAAIVDRDLAWVLLESGPSLWENLHLDSWPDDKCGVVYNGALHGAVPLDDIGEDAPGGGTGQVEDASWAIPIVLDGDATFYNQNPDTAWARQRSLLFVMNLITHWIEPQSAGNIDIYYQLKAQEAWTTVDSGPTETDRYDLRDEINADDYIMGTHPEKNEVSYFSVGYDMSGGIAGVAGGICNVVDYDHTFGSETDPQKNHAWGQQVVDDDGGYDFATFFGRAVVMTHEVGHMVGATHSSGNDTECAGGSFDTMCGNSIMLSGGAGGLAPDYRQPFFTDANDANMATCISEAVD
jgi:hypothetical protein